MASYNVSEGIKFYFKNPEKKRKNADHQKQLQNTTPTTKSEKAKIPAALSKKRSTPSFKLGKLSTISDKMSSRASSLKEEINSVSSISFLPPITVQNADGSISPQKQPVNLTLNDSRYLNVPSDTPDSRYESGDVQKVLDSPECAQCKMDHMKTDTEKKHSRQQKKLKQDIYLPSALPEISTALKYEVHKRSTNSLNYDTPFTSRFLGKSLSLNDKQKKMYSSLDSGLHSYYLEDDEADDEQQLTFRYTMKSHQKVKKSKTPPKSPFRKTILSDIENRRFAKIKEAKEFSSSENVLQGLSARDKPYDDFFDNHAHHEYYQPHKGLYNNRLGKGSHLFMKNMKKDKVKRPFLPISEEKPQVMRGKTILRNPLAPVTLQDRYKPVVVLKSKLDDYTDVVHDFLEYLIDEQRKADEHAEANDLDQDDENLVIYKDLDDIAHMKEMARAVKYGLSTLSKKTKSNPQGQLIKGKTRITKIGSIDPLNHSYRYRTPQNITVGGRSVYIDNTPNNEHHKDTATKTKIPNEVVDSTLSKYNTANVANTSAVPPNTPYAAMQTVGSNTEP